MASMFTTTTSAFNYFHLKSPKPSEGHQRRPARPLSVDNSTTSTYSYLYRPSCEVFFIRTKDNTVVLSDQTLTLNRQKVDELTWSLTERHVIRAALTCDLSFLHREGNDQAEGAEHRIHPIHGADGIIGGLNQSQRGGVSVLLYWELWDMIQREEEEEEEEARQDVREAESWFPKI